MTHGTFTVSIDRQTYPGRSQYASAEAAETAARRYVTGRGGEISIWRWPDIVPRRRGCD
jgi:hypothetical protein